MPTYNGRRFIFTLAALLLTTASQAGADSAVLAGEFDGSEPKMAPFDVCEDPLELVPYRQYFLVVSATGLYQRSVLWPETSPGVWQPSLFRVYQESFDPGLPEANHVAPTPVGWHDGYSLAPDTNYILVVQRPCGAIVDRPWTLALSGPGEIASEAAVQLPDFSRGTLSASDPTTTSSCGSLWGGWGWGPVDDAAYHESGPIPVSRSGIYTYRSAVFDGGALVCLSVHDAPFDPADPAAHRVALLGGYFEQVELQAEKDYYFVTKWSGAEADDSSDNSVGEYLQVLVPPAPFRINAGLSGAWFDEATPGQGYFLTVYEQRNEVFLGYFGFADSAAPDDEFDHRWTTAYGPFEGTKAELEIEWTTGGAFNTPEPTPLQYYDGTLTLEFDNCASGRIIYHGGVAGAVTVIPVVRPANDSVALCESLYSSPGVPGPL